MLLVVQVACLLALTGVVVTRYWQDHIWLGWSMAAVTVAVFIPSLGHPLQRRAWFFYVAGIFVYALLRSYADETFIHVQFDYAIDFDSSLFLGTHPSTWLQSRWFEGSPLNVLDWAAVLMHWSFFIVPHAVAVAIFIWRRDRFPLYVALVVGVMYAGLVLFFLVPTAPPWLASVEGHLPATYRILDYVGGESSRYQTLYRSLAEPNSVAAMPSIHIAATFAIVLWCWESARRLALPAAIYTAGMGFALVYLGEHYIVDELAGLLVALMVFVVVRRFWRAPGEPAPVTPAG